MTIYTARLQRRDFTEFVALPALSLRPLRWSWQALGGPHYAELAVDGDENRLWDTLQWLRCPVKIYADGVPVWWGYVADAAFSTAAVDVAVSLEMMSNRVAVAYSLVEAGTQTVGTRATTAWTEDTTSSAEYGTKELLASIDGATATRAEAVRDRLLTIHKYPIPAVQASGVKNQSLSVGQYSRGGDAVRGNGRLVCLGWWDTLGWKYYANTNTASTVTTTQIGAMVTAAGQFLSGTGVLTASGVSSSEYRAGDNTARAEIEELIGTPTSGGGLLTATVTAERLLLVDAEAASSDSDWVLAAGGALLDRWGSAGLLGESRLGWAQLRGVVPASANLDYMAAPSPLYIEENEFDANEQSYRWRARGVPSAWELSRVVQG